jgi:hypothetical protein
VYYYQEALSMADKPERRELTFHSLEDAVADAERLASGEVRTTGKHIFAQILKHLALIHDMATGKIVGPRPPFFMRLMMPLMKGMILKGMILKGMILKGMILKGPVKPGFKLPTAAESFFWPGGNTDVNEALTHLKESVKNYNTNGPLPAHPVFGKVPHEQNDRLNISHCAMHLSFVYAV